VHLQFELNTFGPFYMNIFLPMLLGLIRLIGLDIVVTVHSVIPQRSITKETVKDLAPKGVWIPPLLLTTFFTLLYSVIGKLSSVVIVHSRAIKRWLVVDYKLKIKKILVVPHGVDYTMPKVEQSALNLWSKQFHGKKVLLSFGVISPRKGIEYLLQALSHVVRCHHECILIISGRTPKYYMWYADQIKSLSKALGIQDKVFFLGPLKNKDVHALFSLADVIILPYAYAFSASGVLSLARQHNKFIISTCHEIIVEQVASWDKVILVPPKDPHSLAKAITNIVNYEFSRGKTSRSQNDSWTNVATETVKIYRSIIDPSYGRRK